MTQAEFQSFLSDIIAQDSTSPWFWNLMALAEHNLGRYSGPKNSAEYEKVLADKYMGAKTKSLYKILLDFYSSLDSNVTKLYLQWVELLAPLVTRGDQRQYRLSDYTNIFMNIDNFHDSKLRYTVLSKIIAKLDARDETDNETYIRARALRAVSDYAKTNQDKKTQEIKISDLSECIKHTDDVATKLRIAKMMINIITKKLQDTLKETDSVAKIKQVCDEAYHYAAQAGAANQDFVNWVWDTFDYHKIISIPHDVTK